MQKDTVHISPGKVKIHLPESLLVQAKRHQKTHTVNLPGEAVNAVSAQLLIVQQKHQDRETDSQTDSQRKITAILQPHMSQRKTDAAFLSLLRDEHTAELVQQIRKSRKEAYSQPNGGHEVRNLLWNILHSIRIPAAPTSTIVKLGFAIVASNR